MSEDQEPEWAEEVRTEVLTRALIRSAPEPGGCPIRQFLVPGSAGGQRLHEDMVLSILSPVLGLLLPESTFFSILSPQHQALQDQVFAFKCC